MRAIGSIDAGRVYEGQRVPLVMRLPDEFRADPEQLEKAIIPTRAGQLLPLGRLASVETASTPSTINREWSRRLIRVQANVRDRDVASFVEEAKSRIAAEVDLPDGYVLDWGGQFQNLERARLRLAIVVPVTLVLIFILLYLSLGQLRDVLIIYTGIPFAAIGGILALQARGIPFSVSAVGFIALRIAVRQQEFVAAIQRARGGRFTSRRREGCHARTPAPCSPPASPTPFDLPMALPPDPKRGGPAPRHRRRRRHPQRDRAHAVVCPFLRHGPRAKTTRDAQTPW